MRLVTWNVNSLTARLEYVTDWMGTEQPDILCLQETKQSDAAFPDGAFAALGYETATTVTAAGTAWPSSAGSAWRTR